MKGKRMHIVTALAALVLLAIAVLAVRNFTNKRLHGGEMTMLRAQEEISRQQAFAIKQLMDAPLGALVQFDDALERFGAEEALPLVEAARKEMGLARVGLIGPDGAARFSDGSDAAGALDGFVGAQGVVRRKAGMSKDLAFCVRAASGGTLVAWYPTGYFNSVLSGLNNEENSYGFITDDTGEMVIAPYEQEDLTFYGSVITLYEEAILRVGSADQVRSDLAAGSKGSVSYRYGNQQRYNAYAPLGVNDWFLFTAVEAAHAGAPGNADRHQINLLGLQLLLVAGTAIILAMVLSNSLRREVFQLRERSAIGEDTRQALEQLSYTILFEADPATGEMRYNDAFERQLGRKPIVTNMNTFLKEGAENPLPKDVAPAWRILAQEMKRGLPKSQVSVQMPGTDGENLWYRVSFRTIYDQGKLSPVRIVGRLANIEWQEQEQDRDLARAEHDELTGLLGHTAFMRQAEKAMCRERAGALLIVDIDGFRRVATGEEQYEGDRILMDMGHALDRVFGGRDLLGRISGDTFAVLMLDHVTAREVAMRADTLCSTFKEYAGQTCSVGIAMYTEEAQTLSEMSHRADKALYRAKLSDKERYAFYDGPITDQMTERHWGGDANLTLNRCAISLLTSEVLAVGADEALREITKYYRADRTYVMQKDAERALLRLRFCWERAGAEPMEETEIELEGKTLMSQAALSGRALTVTQVNEKTVENPRELEWLRARNVKSLYLTPMYWNGAFVGYLGVENPKQHVGNATLFKQVSTCLASAIMKSENTNRPTHEGGKKNEETMPLQGAAGEDRQGSADALPPV